MASHWVYILTCSDGSLYAGYATDIDRRLKEHNSGNGSRYVRSRRPAVISYSSEFRTRSEALREEARIKRMGRGRKLELCMAYASSGVRKLR